MAQVRTLSTIVRIRDQFNEEAWARFVSHDGAIKRIVVQHYGQELYVPYDDVLEFDVV